MKLFKAKSLGLILVLACGFFAVSCGGPVHEGPENGKQGDTGNPSPKDPSNKPPADTYPPGLPEQNYLEADLPDDVCANENFEIVLKEYLAPKCLRCHQKGGTPPYLGTRDVSLAIVEFSHSFKSKSDFDTYLLKNKYCQSNCSIDSRSQTYQVIHSWLDCQ